MKKDLKYYIYLLLAVGLFLVYELSKPKIIDWGITLSSYDKNPYGNYVLDKVLPDFLQNNAVIHSNYTIYELSNDAPENLLIFCEYFSADENDVKALLEMVENGTHAFIAASGYSGELADTLNIKIDDNFTINNFSNLKYLEDSTFLQFVNPRLDNEKYFFKERTIAQYFSSIDSLRTTVLAVNREEYPILIKTNIGNGSIIMASTPLAFTNYYMLWENNNEFISNALSYLPSKATHWTEYYQVGRLEARTPFRFILNNPSLKWAYYIASFTLLLFIIFEAKRKQRIIPIVKPPENMTVEFAKTVGNLYLNHGDHHNLAIKKITYFKEYIRSHYYLPTHEINEDFIISLSNKSEQALEKVKTLIMMIKAIEAKKKISAEELIKLCNKIDDFINN